MPRDRSAERARKLTTCRAAICGFLTRQACGKIQVTCDMYRNRGTYKVYCQTCSLCMLPVQLVLKEYEETKASIPSVFEPLMVPHLQTVNVVVEQGLTAITWGSLNISAFVDSVRRALKQFQLVISRASAILEHRICRTLQSMSEVSLCKLPDGEQWTIHTLVSRTEVGACMGNE